MRQTRPEEKVPMTFREMSLIDKISVVTIAPMILIVTTFWILCGTILSWVDRVIDNIIDY